MSGGAFDYNQYRIKEIYGDEKEPLVENISQNTKDSGKKSTLEEDLNNLKNE
jgi:hypothetical protein